jgi:hypothetical protein
MKPSPTEIAARALAADAEAAEAPSPAAKKAVVAAMARAMRARRRRRIGWLVGGAVASVAAAVALTVAMRKPTELAAIPAPPQHEAVALATVIATEGTPSVARGSGREPLATGRTLAAADHLVVPEGAGATVGLFRGTRLVLSEGTELTLASMGPTFAFDLATGAVRADVAKLNGSERFLVRTADAEVEVHGTSFRVARVLPAAACGGGTTTRVVVYEGIVSVRSRGVETRVHPGEQWPSGCEASIPTNGTTAPPSPLSPPSPPSPPSPQQAHAPTIAHVTPPDTSSLLPPPAPTTTAAVPEPAPTPASDLAAQNDLFARAVAKKGAGDARGAVSAFEELLTRYPGTHLAQSARADRMRLLQTYDAEGARVAARDYLVRYPNGFAKSDAEIILGGR